MPRYQKPGPTSYRRQEKPCPKQVCPDSCDESDDGEEKIMVERYWNKAPVVNKACDPNCGEEKIIISRTWKKKGNDSLAARAAQQKRMMDRNRPSESTMRNATGHESPRERDRHRDAHRNAAVQDAAN
ncbi:hypothetical protein AAHC03_05231 [Spirometra sp. Aus1]